MSDRRQDGAQGFDTHGDVQKMSGKEEVVVMSKKRHQQVPNQVQESLDDERGPSVTLYSSEFFSSFNYTKQFCLNSHCQ